MSLPDSWADALFSKLTVRYGTAFMRQYEGVDLALVRGDWQTALSGFAGRQIAYALDNLPPDRPPNALQFKALCLRAPLEEFKRLPAPAVGDMPPDVREKLADLKAMGSGGLDWARRLREREQAGESLTMFQREAWRRALREGEEPQGRAAAGRTEGRDAAQGRRARAGSMTQHCPGAKSPFGHQTFRRCIAECPRYRYGATDLVPAMKMTPAGVRECVNMVPRGGA